MPQGRAGPQEPLPARTKQSADQGPCADHHLGPAPPHRRPGNRVTLAPSGQQAPEAGDTADRGPAEGPLPKAKGRQPLALEAQALGWSSRCPHTPSTVRPWPTAVGRLLSARPGQLSVQPRPNKGFILWAEGGLGHRGGCLGRPGCWPRPARARAARRQGAAQLGLRLGVRIPCSAHPEMAAPVCLSAKQGCTG